MATVEINEIFYSLQGESSWAGLPCAFVRLAGCPLECRWCDTGYAKGPGRMMAVSQVVAQAVDYGVGLAEVTGGEPLAQASTPELIAALCEEGLTVLLETSGCVVLPELDARAHIIMDVKCPSSGMTARMHWPNLVRLTPKDEVKFVVADREDYDFAKGVIAQHGLAHGPGLLMSAVAGELEPQDLAAWMLTDRLEARLQIQLHKHLWGDARGV